MLEFLTLDRRAVVQQCLDVDMSPSSTHEGLWDCRIQVVDRDPAMQLPPYTMDNASPEDLARQLGFWSSAHGRGAPLPVYFRKVEPQVLAIIQAAA